MHISVPENSRWTLTTISLTGRMGFDQETHPVYDALDTLGVDEAPIWLVVAWLEANGRSLTEAQKCVLRALVLAPRAVRVTR